jgi:hypothetical protein
VLHPEHPRDHLPASAVRAWAQPTLRRRLGYAWRRFFLSRQGLAAFYGVPAHSPRVWLLYLHHPLSLLRRYGRSLWRLLRADPAARATWDREAWLERWLRGAAGGGTP